MSFVPYVVEQSAHGERSYDIFSRLLNDRIIVLSEDVNDTSASLVVAQLLYLEGQDPEKDINFYINSPGGSITDGMAIYDTMRYIKCDVSTICVGMAASMASVLLAAGAKGKRFALPNSEILIHQPLIGGQVGLEEMSGPVGIVSTIGDTYKESRVDGWYYVTMNMIMIAILLSVNLGVMNLLPIPALDGCKLIFLLIEAIFGRAAPQKLQMVVNTAGMALLLWLMVLVTMQDITRFL